MQKQIWSLSLNVMHNPVNNNYEQRENIFQDFLEIMHKSIYHGIHAIVFEGFYNNFCSGTDTCFLAIAPTVYVIKIFIHIKIFYLYFSIRIILICLRMNSDSYQRIHEIKRQGDDLKKREYCDLIQ